MSNNDAPNTEKFTPRRPVRGPGIIRYKELLDATEALLNESNPDDIGIYQIAAKAKAPTASAYQFFPTKDAAFLALSEHYFMGLIRVSALPIDVADIKKWQSLIVLDLRRASDFYNAHPAAMKIFLGGYSSQAILASDREFQVSISNALRLRLQTIFELPEIENIESKFHYCIVMMDAIWSLSYHLYGKITEGMLQESCKALLSYLEIYISKTLKIKDEIKQAQRNNEKLALPPYGPME